MTTLNLTDARRNRVMRILSFAIFLAFFQGYMVAPLLPRLATIFSVSIEKIGLIVPAYFLAYGAATLVYGPLSDRVGRLPVIFSSLVAFAILTGATALAHSPSQLIWIRLLAGLSASGITPISIGLVGDLFPYRERGHALGLIFGAVAGGMACGSTAGVLLEPLVGWRGLFLLVGVLAGLVAVASASLRGLVLSTHAPATRSDSSLMHTLFNLLSSSRSRRTYTYVVLFGLFQSGVYTWLGLLFSERYGLSDVGIGCALLGYGIPGWLMGPTIGRASDRWGRNRIIPLGIAISGVASLTLAFSIPVLVAALVVTIISLGCDMTQPALAAIVTDLTPNRGLAMGVFAFSLFTGFGLGSLVFGWTLRYGLETGFFAFGVAAIIGAFCSNFLFRSEGLPDEPAPLPRHADQAAK